MTEFFLFLFLILVLKSYLSAACLCHAVATINICLYFILNLMIVWNSCFSRNANTLICYRFLLFECSACILKHSQIDFNTSTTYLYSYLSVIVFLLLKVFKDIGLKSFVLRMSGHPGMSYIDNQCWSIQIKILKLIRNIVQLLRSAVGITHVLRSVLVMGYAT